MKNRNRLVSILAGIMALVMLLSLLVTILPVSAAAADEKSSTEIKEELNALKGDRSELREQLKELASKQDKTWESIEEMVELKNNIDPNATYYIVTDSYCSQYAYNRLTVVEQYDNETFARDLVAEFLGG